MTNTNINNTEVKKTKKVYSKKVTFALFCIGWIIGMFTYGITKGLITHTGIWHAFTTNFVIVNCTVGAILAALVTINPFKRKKNTQQQNFA